MRGESNLKYTVTMGDFSRISPLVGRTLAGRAQAEGTLAGTSTDPTVAATVKASEREGGHHLRGVEHGRDASTGASRGAT